MIGRLIRGIIGTVSFGLIVFLGTIVVLLCGWWPVKVRHIRLGPWVVHWMCRLFLRIIRVHIQVDRPKVLRRHEGFIFANHTTYMDIIALLAVTPVRFVAKAEIEHWPFIGWLASWIGCVFVARDSPDSRRQTRHTLTQVDLQPPIALYPEGRTAPIGRLLPFRRGAFEIAHAGEIVFIPCAVIYSDPALVDWKTRSGGAAFWDIMSRPGVLRVEMHVLDEVQPRPKDDPADLCAQTRVKMLNTLVDHGNYAPETAATDEKLSAEA